MGGQADEGLPMQEVVQQSDQPAIDLVEVAPVAQEVVPAELPLGERPLPPGAPPPGEPPSRLPPPDDVPPLVMPQTTGGSTRKLPNTEYFADPVTQEIIDFSPRAQVLRDAQSWAETKNKAAALHVEELLGKPPTFFTSAEPLPI
jgi:hypothetical protein